MAKLKSKTYREFTSALQPNSQDYSGGFWTSAHINLDKELGIITPSRSPFTRHTDTDAFKVVGFCAYTENVSYDLYAVQDETTTGHILARDVSAQTWSELLDLTTYVPTGGIIRFNGNLHWGTTTYLSKYDGTTQTDNYKALKVTQTTGKYIPMVVFSGKLYVGNMRYVATLDTAGTWVDDKLILPAGQRVVDMRVYNDKIAILTVGDTVAVDSHLFFWDGDSATYDENIQINDVGAQALFPYMGEILIFGSGGRILEYAGQAAEGQQNFQVLAEVPGRILIQNPSCIVEHEGLVTFGVLPKTSNSIGMWKFGKLPLTNKVVLFQSFTPRGSYYYDPGVVDYYGVTSLYNSSDLTSGYTIENNTADTFADDATVGTQTWDTPANAELSDDAYATCTAALSYRGYHAGGKTAADAYQTAIRTFVFSTEALSTITGVLATARIDGAGVNSATRGYLMGGYTGASSTEVDGIVFADESSNNPAAAVGAAQYLCGTNSSTKGYGAGDNTTAIDGLVFATEAIANPVGTLAAARYLVGGTNSSTVAYYAGGQNGGNSTEIDGITFATEASNNPAAVLTVARYGVMGLNSSTKGYYGGGFAADFSNVIDVLTFATETIAASATTLVTARYDGAGINSGTYGFWIGGSASAGYSTEIDGIKFSDDSAYNPTAVLDLALIGGAGFQYGYV